MRSLIFPTVAKVLDLPRFSCSLLGRSTFLLPAPCLTTASTTLMPLCGTGTFFYCPGRRLSTFTSKQCLFDFCGQDFIFEGGKPDFPGGVSHSQFLQENNFKTYTMED